MVISCNIEISTTDKEKVLNNIKSAITEYIGNLSFRKNELSYGKIYQIIFNTDNVIDCENLKINNGVVNIYCDDTEIFNPVYDLRC